VQLFSACSGRQLARIASLVDELEVPEGRVLMRQGDLGLEAFVVVEGRARASIRGKGSAVLGPGACFGEMALLHSGRRSATVTAESDMRLLVLRSRDFSALIDDVPTVARRVMEAVAERLRDAERAQPHH
jgi:CRP-like cAMP-binding protein